MRVTCIQMDMQLGKVNENFAHAKALIEEAMKDKPDVLVLPETWDTGYFPKENLESICDQEGKRVKAEIGGLAKAYNVNIVAGSVANVRRWASVWEPPSAAVSPTTAKGQCFSPATAVSGCACRNLPPQYRKICRC